MKKPIVRFENLWEVGDATGQPCTLCEDPIYSQTHTYYLLIDGKRKIEIGVCACSSCYEILKEDHAFQ